MCGANDPGRTCALEPNRRFVAKQGFVRETIVAFCGLEQEAFIWVCPRTRFAFSKAKLEVSDTAWRMRFVQRLQGGSAGRALLCECQLLVRAKKFEAVLLTRKAETV